MALEEPADDDHIMEVNEIKLAIEPMVLEYTKDLELDFDPKWERFYLNGLDDC